MALPPYVQQHEHNIFTIDTGFKRPGFDAAYLLTHAGRAVFIDTGTNHSVARLLETLSSLAIPRENVEWIVPTHVHLDHAGGVGELAAQLPAARVLVHPRGARHIIDPSKLYQGALQVYGQQVMDADYGELRPVAAERVCSSTDGQVLDLAGRKLLLLDTPGHARHHHCIWDETSRGVFAGDTFGLSYRELDTSRGPWVLITSTPVQFAPDALRASIRRLLALDPRHMFLTHFGRVGSVNALAAQQLRLLERIVALGESVRAVGARHEALKRGLRELYIQELRAHGSQLGTQAILDLLEMDVELNAQGMGVWLDRDRG